MTGIDHIARRKAKEEKEPKAGVTTRKEEKEHLGASILINKASTASIDPATAKAKAKAKAKAAVIAITMIDPDLDLHMAIDRDLRITSIGIDPSHPVM